MEHVVDETRPEYYQTSWRDRLLHPAGARQQHGRTQRVWLSSILAAVGLLAVSTGSAKYYYAKGQANALATVYRSSATTVSNLGVTEDDHKGEDVNPKDTYVCTGDFTLPVLQGVDLVAYWFLEQDAPAVMGSEDNASTYNGYLFYFSSAENQKLFEENPEKYMPAYGGFCGWAIAREEQWQAYNLGPGPDLDLWAISEDVDNVLHLFRGKSPRDKFRDKFRANVKMGDIKWNSWFGTSGYGADGVGAPLDTFCFRN